MAKESTKHYLRSIDVDKKLVSSIDNGIIILDEELNIFYFNQWLEIHTHLKKMMYFIKSYMKFFHLSV